MRASVTVVLVAMVALGVAVAPAAAAAPLRGLAPSVDYCTTCLAVVDEIEVGCKPPHTPPPSSRAVYH